MYLKNNSVDKKLSEKKTCSISQNSSLWDLSCSTCLRVCRLRKSCTPKGTASVSTINSHENSVRISNFVRTINLLVQTLKLIRNHTHPTIRVK